MLDHAIFAGGVHGLEDEQDRPLVLGVEFVLKVRHQGEVALEQVGAFLLGIETPGLGGVEILQAEGFSMVHPESACQLDGFLAGLHGCCFTARDGVGAKEAVFHKFLSWALFKKPRQRYNHISITFPIR